MKHFFQAIVIIGLLILPCKGFSYYQIYLKNGSQFETNLYWEEGGQIKFYTRQGIVGIPKNSVDKIKKSPLRPEETSEIKKQPKKLQETRADSPKADASETNRKGDFKKDSPFPEDIKRLEKRFELRKNMTVEELDHFKNELTLLRDKISSDSSAEFFSEEITKLSDMRFFINDLIIIKSRDSENRP